MIQIKYFLKTLQQHHIIFRDSKTSEIKHYKLCDGYEILYNGHNIQEISYDRTMPEYIWLVLDDGWKQLELSLLNYEDFRIYQTIEIF